MTFNELIQDLANADIRLWVSDAQLRYSAPPGALTAERRRWIGTHKPALLNLLASGAEAPMAAEPGVLPVLSCAQERLWLLEQLEGPSGLYNEGRALLVRGNLDVDALQRSLNLLVQRHQVLRCRFFSRDGQAQLECDDERPLTLQQSDFSQTGDDSAAAIQQALELMSLESQRPFDLSQAPLARFPLVRIDAQTHVLGVFMHHIICDGLSMAIVLDELSTAYAAYCRTETPSLMPLPVQYSDFARWQRQQHNPQLIGRELDYWRTALAGLPLMALGDAGGERRLSKGAVHRFQLPSELMLRLDQLARDNGVTVFALISTTYHILLSSYSDTLDVHFSTPITERRRSELQGLIGLFVNSVVLRQQLNPELQFNATLQATRELIQRAFAHQQTPFERVVDALGQGDEQRDMSRTQLSAALAQARLVYLEGLGAQLNFHDLQVEPFAVNRRLAKFELMLTVERSEDHCACDFEYKTAVFSTALIEHLAQAFEQLLNVAALAPQRRIGELRQDLAYGRMCWQQTQTAQRQQARRSSLRSIQRRAAG